MQKFTAATVVGLFAVLLAVCFQAIAPVSETEGKTDIPEVVDQLYFGVPAGNGDRPRRLAIDDQGRRLYSLNEGTAARHPGNSVSIIDLDTEQITNLIELDNMPAASSFPPAPLDLQVDPYRPHLYALAGDRYTDSPSSSLTIIDTDRLAVLDTLPGVEALAVGPDRLYLANDNRLWTVDPSSLVELNSKTLVPRQYNDLLLLDAEANRLYLVRGSPWSVEIFSADSLTPVGSYAASGQIIQAALDTANQRLLIVESNGSEVDLRALDSDGAALSNLGPVSLSDNIAYSTPPVTIIGSTLYLVDGNITGDYGYRLRAFSLPDLAAQGSLSLPALPYDLTHDPATGRLYAPYSSPDSFVLKIEPNAGSTEAIYTALELIGGLADPATDRLYVLNNAGTLRILDLVTYNETTQIETGLSRMTRLDGYTGQLALDPGRNRLYLSGNPVRVVDTATLQVTSYPGLQGQITPDPTGDRLYLTEPCECRMEQCNTLILNATTMTGTATLFPPQDPLGAPCVQATKLDEKNQLLYATIYNGVAGSNSGNFFTVFNTSSQPRQIYTAGSISYGQIALDPPGRRAFAPRYRIDRAFIHRFGAEGQSFTQTLELVGAQGQLAYEPANDRLYAVSGQTLQLFDGELALQAEIPLPGEFDLLTSDPENQRLYLRNDNGQMLVVAPTGGELQPPPPVTDETDERFRPRLFVAADGTRFHINNGRLYRSGDDGGSWQLLGRGLPDRAVSDLGLPPTYAQNPTLLAGLWHFGRLGGLFRSTDGGDTWLPTTRGLTDLEVQEIAFSPTFGQDQTVFLTTLFRGLFRSSDGGDTWIPLASRYSSDSYDQKLSSLALSPTFAADGLVLIGYRNLLRSTDGGDTWTNTGLPSGLAAFSPTYAGDGLVLLDGSWRSTDGGQSWQPAAAGREPSQQVVNILFSPTFAADQTIYLLFYRDYLSPLRLQRSTDAGQTWQSLQSGLPADFDPVAATILPDGELYLSNFEGELLTVPPKELNWGRPPMDITRLDLQDLAIGPDGTMFVINGAAGVFKSDDGGRTWQETDFPARAADFPPAQLVMAGEGTLFAAVSTALEWSPDLGQRWTYLANLPHDFTIISLAVSPDFQRDGLVFTGGNYRKNQLLRSVDGGQRWEVAFDGSTIEEAGDVKLIAFSPNFDEDGKLYGWLENGGLLHSADRGQTWTVTGGQYSHYSAQSLAISPDGGRVYVGAIGGHLLVSADKGQSWRNLGSNISDQRTWSSAISLTPDGAIFLGTDVGVYRSLDGGQSWTQASAGLPLDPQQGSFEQVRALEIKEGRLYAALAEGGVFVSDDRGESWHSSRTAPAQPAATSTPPAKPTVQPQPTAVPVECSGSPDYFADLWSERREQLGCPSGVRPVMLVEQTFEGGRMFWRSDLAVIYTLLESGSYAQFEDTWEDSQPAYTCPEVGPQQTPPTPQRGFGKVWCTQPQVRQGLGNATSPERPFETTLQEFERGLIFQTDEGVIYILESQTNGWERK